MDQVRVYHPELDTTIQVPESAVPIHRVSGWIPADEYVPPADENADDDQGSAEPAATGEKKPTKAQERRQQQKTEPQKSEEQ